MELIVMTVINYGYLDHSHERLIFSTRPAVWLALFCLLRGVGVSAQTPTLIGCFVFKEHAVFRSAQKRNYDASFSTCQPELGFCWRSVTTSLQFFACIDDQSLINLAEHLQQRSPQL
jgi:hypothetical protein